MVQRVLVTTDLPSWDLQLRSDPPSYALGATTNYLLLLARTVLQPLSLYSVSCIPAATKAAPLFKPSLGHGLGTGGWESVLRLDNALFFARSRQSGHGPLFGLKHPLRGPHSGRAPLPNPFDAVRPCCQSRRQTPRCDGATTSPSLTPRRLPTAGSGRLTCGDGIAPELLTRPRHAGEWGEVLQNDPEVQNPWQI